MLDISIFYRRKIKLVRQMEITECGIACLVMVANYHRSQIEIRDLRRTFSASVRGSTFKDLIEVAGSIGFSARAVGVAEKSLSKLRLPAILHWENSHFVVLERIVGPKARIHDPAHSSTWITLEDLKKSFTGAALELEPELVDFSRPGSGRLRISSLWGRLVGFKSSIVQTVLLSILLHLGLLIMPYYMQLALDVVLPSLDLSLLTTLALGFGFVAIINASVALLRGFVLLNAGTLTGFGLTSNITRKLFRLPISWFERRSTGDILSKTQSVLPIQQFLTEGAVASIVDGALAISTLFILLMYSPLLSVVVGIALLLSIIAKLISYNIEREATNAAILATNKEQSVFLETIKAISIIRLFNAETLRYSLWQSLKADATNANVNIARAGIWYGTANSLIFGLEAIISIWIGTKLIIDGSGFSVGMLFAFIAYKAQFITKSESLIDQYAKYKMLSLHMERLSDITLTDDDFGFSSAPESKYVIDGEIELKNIKYRYSDRDPYILDCLDLKVGIGDHIAITGASGCGKSTLVKILLGLVVPSEGQIFVDGHPLNELGYKNYHQQVVGILQDDNLFAGSLLENISLFAPSVDMDKVIEVAKIAAIHDEIMKMPMQYYSLVGDMGSALSGGQKQRIVLARALYRNPKILIIDEGTSHLDSTNEMLVNESVRKMGITRIIIAHRKETIESADRIYTLNQGRLEELTHAIT